MLSCSIVVFGMKAPMLLSKQSARRIVPPPSEPSLRSGDIVAGQSEKRIAADIVDRRTVVGDLVTPIGSSSDFLDLLESIGFGDEGDEFAGPLHMPQPE